jgi:hypothetical protein
VLNARNVDAGFVKSVLHSKMMETITVLNVVHELKWMPKIRKKL